MSEFFHKYIKKEYRNYMYSFCKSGLKLNTKRTSPTASSNRLRKWDSSKQKMMIGILFGARNNSSTKYMRKDYSLIKELTTFETISKCVGRIYLSEI